MARKHEVGEMTNYYRYLRAYKKESKQHEMTSAIFTKEEFDKLDCAPDRVAYEQRRPGLKEKVLYEIYVEKTCAPVDYNEFRLHASKYTEA